ncbi:lipid II:glycine glycyltransferase FemX [Specibacter cremeus]|uniref:lipid II:glycine glycyltransferase FemX n=1 Tax=Specibacter cremeus TaxID=1629051 RepID=UPI000F7906A7|nr:peptidoglycan bridge formation glycyltransferase FemA/FemB family protein [Specibacter cremeus]
MIPILQTTAWAAFQRSLGKTVHEAGGPGWGFVAIEEKTPLGTYLYVPYGPCASDTAAFRLALGALRALAKRRKCHYVRVEPVAAGLGGADDAAARLQGAGLVRAPKDIQPHLSWKIDLTRPVEELLAGMRGTSRNLYRNIHKKGVTFESSTDPADLPVLLGFLHAVSGRAEFKAQSDDYLSKAAATLMPAGAAKLFIARLDGEPIAAALSYDTADARVYAHAAADDAHRKLNAGIPLLVTMMMDAREAGMGEFDMWGVSPEDEPDHPWAGFSRFKRSFGGAQVEYPGTWDLPVNVAMYRAYGLARRLRTGAARALRTIQKPVQKPVRNHTR